MRFGWFIGGEWRRAETCIDVNDPATELPFGSVANAPLADCLDAVAATAHASVSWAATAPRERGSCSEPPS